MAKQGNIGEQGDGCAKSCTTAYSKGVRISQWVKENTLVDHPAQSKASPDKDCCQNTGETYIHNDVGNRGFH